MKGVSRKIRSIKGFLFTKKRTIPGSLFNFALNVTFTSEKSHQPLIIPQ